MTLCFQFFFNFSLKNISLILKASPLSSRQLVVLNLEFQIHQLSLLIFVFEVTEINIVIIIVNNFIYTLFFLDLSLNFWLGLFRFYYQSLLDNLGLFTNLLLHNWKLWHRCFYINFLVDRNFLGLIV